MSGGKISLADHEQDIVTTCSLLRRGEDGRVGGSASASNHSPSGTHESLLLDPSSLSTDLKNFFRTAESSKISHGLWWDQAEFEKPQVKCTVELNIVSKFKVSDKLINSLEGHLRSFSSEMLQDVVLVVVNGDTSRYYWGWDDANEQFELIGNERVWRLDRVNLDRVPPVDHAWSFVEALYQVARSGESLRLPHVFAKGKPPDELILSSDIENAALWDSSRDSDAFFAHLMRQKGQKKTPGLGLTFSLVDDKIRIVYASTAKDAYWILWPLFRPDTEHLLCADPIVPFSLVNVVSCTDETLLQYLGFERPKDGQPCYCGKSYPTHPAEEVERTEPYPLRTEALTWIKEQYQAEAPMPIKNWELVSSPHFYFAADHTALLDLEDLEDKEAALQECLTRKWLELLRSQLT